MDYLESEIAPDLMRFLKSKVSSSRIKSYYNFLRFIGEEGLPIFSDNENKFIDNIEEMLPLVRKEEYLIIKELVNYNEVKINKLMELDNRISRESIIFSLDYLEKKGIIKNNKLNIENISNIRKYLEELLEYGLTRYEIEFGEFEGEYKLYSNYTKEQTMIAINKSFLMNIKLKGTYCDENGNTYVYVGLKKDKAKELRTNYKDKFINSKVFQWESENNTTTTNAMGLKLQNSKKVYVFVRKMDEEDNVILPFTYFGTGKFTNMRKSQVIDQENGQAYQTLLFDIVLDNEVPDEYHVDFEIPNNME